MKRETSRRLILIGIAFGVGIAAGAVGYKNISRWIKKHKTNAAQVLGPYERQGELLRGAFVGRLAADEELVNPPCQTAEQVAEQVAAVCATPAAGFDTAYAKMTLRDGGAPAGERLKLTYELDQAYDAYAYRLGGPANTSRAVLIIPGSGVNQSSAIFRGEEKNYHGQIAKLAAKHADVYVQVKPNEDFLAIHNGKKKLSYDFIINSLLNRGGCYSAPYVIDGLAITKRLQAQYKEVSVLGLSQGGSAAMLNVLQSKPTGAVIASGFSVRGGPIENAGHRQIIIPGVWTRFDNETIRRMLQSSPTRLLLTYGKLDNAVYRAEAHEGFTKAFLASLKNVRVTTHEGGHEFPMTLVDEFLSPAKD